MRKMLIILFVSLFFHAAAQPVFISQGTILFERKVNSLAIMPVYMKEVWEMNDDEVATDMSRRRERMKQFHTDDFELHFDKTRSWYLPVAKEGWNRDSYTPFFMMTASENKVYNDFTTGAAITEKQVYEKLFFIKDSLKNIEWKITEEIREIAGYSCRRANAFLAADSMYVVAFYTDDILTPGGPESFHGLPGMILGVALPHLHITIFAKNVNPQESTPEKLKMPKPGKKITPMNHKEVMATLTREFRKYSALKCSWVRQFFKI